jgi:hypothetical protein
MKKYKMTEFIQRKTIDTTHAIERYHLRYKDKLPKDKIYFMIDEVKNKIISKYNDKEATYGWHSISTGAGGIIDWRKDTMNLKDVNNHAIIVSLLPIKTFHTFKPTDIKIIIEKQVELLIKERGIKLNENKEKNFCESYHLGNNVYASFFEGKLYDFYLDGYILVD